MARYMRPLTHNMSVAARSALPSVITGDGKGSRLPPTEKFVAAQ